MQDKTAEKIIKATMELIAEEGYKGTTTNKIAQKAGVSEVTIFRKFKSKKEIVSTGLKNLDWPSRFSSVFEKNCHWDLALDLQNYADEYMNMFHDAGVRCFFNLNKKEFEEFGESVAFIPEKLIQPLADYLEQMTNLEKIQIKNPEWIARTFITYLFGLITSSTVWPDKFQEEQLKSDISNVIQLYVKQFTKK